MKPWRATHVERTGARRAFMRVGDKYWTEAEWLGSTAEERGDKQELPDPCSQWACGDIAPDGKHRCCFGNSHEVKYHSYYPLEWWEGRWLRTAE